MIPSEKGISSCSRPLVSDTTCNPPTQTFLFCQQYHHSDIQVKRADLSPDSFLLPPHSPCQIMLKFRYHLPCTEHKLRFSLCSLHFLNPSLALIITYLSFQHVLYSFPVSSLFLSLVLMLHFKIILPNPHYVSTVLKSSVTPKHFFG